MKADGDSGPQDERYFVVRNHEEQYSIWRTSKPIPMGWQTVGEAAERAECLRRIGELWRDMRPASLRRRMTAVDGNDNNTD